MFDYPRELDGQQQQQQQFQAQVAHVQTLPDHWSTQIYPQAYTTHPDDQEVLQELDGMGLGDWNMYMNGGFSEVANDLSFSAGHGTIWPGAEPNLDAAVLATLQQQLDEQQNLQQNLQQQQSLQQQHPQQQQQYQQQQQQQLQQGHHQEVLQHHHGQEQELLRQQQLQQLYRLQQQQQLRMQLEIASRVQLPLSPGPSVIYSSVPPSPHQMPQYISGLKQFPNGYSPSNSPLSPGNYAGDDYFSSRQVTPGTASSPGGSIKIKSRPRTSTPARISQGGIKALFGQGSNKGNRASLDLKSEATNQPTLSPTLSHQVPSTDTPKTPPPRRKRAPKAVSAELPVIKRHSIATAMVVEQLTHRTPSETSPPPMTLAERRAAAAALGAQRRTVSESSVIDHKPSVIGKSLIPPRLGLDPRANRLVLSPNTTPGESGPLASPSILSSSASSPAPIQIDRITPRHSSSQARTEDQQRQMDAAMERVNFDDVTVSELKEMLRQRGKHGGGKKAELIMRLQSEIEIIRANRLAGVRSSATGPAIPPPLASPTHALYSTLGGMHIGSPPIHPAASNLPNVRVTPYSPLNEQGDAQGSFGQNRGVDSKDGDISPNMPKNMTKRDTVSPSPRLSQLGTSYISSDGTVVQSHRHQRALSASSRMELTQGSKQPSPPPVEEDGKGMHTVAAIDTSFMFDNLAMDTSMAFSQDEMDLFLLGPQDSHTGSAYADGFSWQ
ncbi:hypothetical protein BGZ92_003620 [Podila epicladia]|nr:hypothetical protein BGZ92_003620 [Podila epicladia]